MHFVVGLGPGRLAAMVIVLDSGRLKPEKRTQARLVGCGYMVHGTYLGLLPAVSRPLRMAGAPAGFGGQNTVTSILIVNLSYYCLIKTTKKVLYQ